MEDKEKNFDALHEKAVFYLNELMRTREVSKSDKWVLKLNRMSRNLMNLHDEVHGNE